MKVKIDKLKDNKLNQEVYGVTDVNSGTTSIDDKKVSVASLVEQIKSSRYIRAILIKPDNTIISGHRRVKACKELGITEIEAEIITDKTELEYEELFLLENANRIKSKRQILKEYSMWKEIESKKALLRQKTLNNKTLVGEIPTSEDKGRSRDKAAKHVGKKDGKTLDDSLKTLEEIEQIEDVKQKEIISEMFDKSTKEAKKVMKMSADDRKKVLSKIDGVNVKSVNHAIALGREEIKVKEYKEVVTVKPTITEASYKDWLPKQDKCDLLITDPPYSTDVKDINGFAKEWLPLALGRVKDTGSAYVCIGGYPEEVQAYLNVRIPTQMLIWTYQNATLLQPKDKYNQNYQVILYYRFKNTPEINKPSTVVNQFACQTINAPDGRQGDRYHTWQKPTELADRLILNSSKEGDVILDPFVCTGTFILSANKLGRIGKGCDIDAEAIKIAVTRGCTNE